EVSHRDICLSSYSQRRNALAAAWSGAWVSTAWDTELMRWNRPFGPAGLRPWSVTFAISGKSRLPTTRIDEALFVQEICSPKNALLLLMSVQPSTSSNIVSL